MLTFFQEDNGRGVDLNVENTTFLLGLKKLIQPLVEKYSFYVMCILQ